MGETYKVGSEIGPLIPESKPNERPKEAGFPLPTRDTTSIAAAGEVSHTTAEGPVISLGVVEGIHVYVTIPKDIFQNYPQWMKRNLDLDLEGWNKLSKVNQTELDSGDTRGAKAAKAFFDIVQLFAALASGEPAAVAMISDIGPKDGVLFVKVEPKDESQRLEPLDPNQERLKQKVADFIVNIILLPATLIGFVGKIAGKVLDTIGNGLEFVWNRSQPVVAPIGNIIAMLVARARRFSCPFCGLFKGILDPPVLRKM